MLLGSPSKSSGAEQTQSFRKGKGGMAGKKKRAASGSMPKEGAKSPSKPQPAKAEPNTPSCERRPCKQETPSKAKPEVPTPSASTAAEAEQKKRKTNPRGVCKNPSCERDLVHFPLPWPWATCQEQVSRHIHTHPWFPGMQGLRGIHFVNNDPRDPSRIFCVNLGKLP